MKNNLNVFSGKNSVLDFINPDNNSPTPLVEIPQNLNPYYPDGVRIFAKLMHFNALGNVKSLPALNMLSSVKNKDIKIDTLIENSSGNTVFSLAVIGRLLGIHSTKAFVSNQVTWGKLQLLRILGVQPIVNDEPICPDPEDKSSIYKAKILGNQPGWFNPGQYDNEENPKAHYRWTGPQIWEQTEGKISVFCAGMGTTGTIFGTSKFLKEMNNQIKTVGVVRLPNNPVPGVRTPNLLRQIAFSWKKTVDETTEVGTIDSFRQSLNLSRYGLLVGPSSGFAFQGLLDFLKNQKEQDKMDSLKNKDGEIVCVFICCDSPLPYLSEYFEYLPDTDFPKIENEELLLNKSKSSNTNATSQDINYEISASEAIQELYSKNQNILWKMLEQKEQITLKHDVALLDVRTSKEFSDSHAPLAINIDHRIALSKLKILAKEYKDKTVFVICHSGGRSGLVVSALRESNIEAYNIIGGMIEWSKQNFPRWRPEICTNRSQKGT